MPSEADFRLRALAAALCAAALLAAVTPARGAEVTRSSYREAVEPICKANTEANERILAGVRSEVRHGRMRPAAAKFARAARALRRTLAELRSVAPPSADLGRLKRWLGKVSVEASLFGRVATQLRAGRKAQAEQLVVKLTNNANQANGAVIAFEFQYCRFEPARFT